MSFASTLGKYGIDGASRTNKSWPGSGKAATWFFDVAKVKTALDPTNVSSTSVTSTPTTTPTTVVTAAPTVQTITTAIPTVQAVTPVVATPVQPIVVIHNCKFCMYCGAQLKKIAKFCTECGNEQ